MDSRRITISTKKLSWRGKIRLLCVFALELLLGTGIVFFSLCIFVEVNILSFSLAGYPEAAAANILHAVQAAVERGSLGSFVATWTDSVALGSLHFAWPGWILQAGLAWNHTIHWVKPLKQYLLKL